MIYLFGALRGFLGGENINMVFREIELKSLMTNPFATLNDDWAILSAGTEKDFNAMTIGWGGMGVLWHKPVVTIFVRPQRYTKEFIDRFEMFTVSFFPQEHKNALVLLGSKSGREGDKIAESALTPAFIDGTVAFEEAHTVFVCRKLFGGQQLDASKFVDSALDSRFYPTKDYSFIYFGEIERILQHS